MKILQFNAENIKRISTVEIVPEGSTVVLGGRNGDGKSSCLDAIWYALAGTKDIPAQPIRKGADAAEVKLNLGDFVVLRKFKRKADGEITTQLEIKSRDGYEVPSPQKMLDELRGKMSFDPLEFSRLKPREQLESLKELVGLDFTETDRKRDSVYTTRTTVNRNLKAKQAELSACQHYADAPSVEVSLAELAEELQKANDTNAGYEKVGQSLKDETANYGRLFEALGSAHQDVKDLEEQLAAAKAVVQLKEQSVLESGKLIAQIEAKIAECIYEDTTIIQTKIRESESINAKVRQNAKHAALAGEVTDLTGQSDKLTGELKSIEEAKSQAMEAANFPVAGLGFDADGITLNGLPFEQASRAEQIRVCVAMAIALNPKLRVMWIKDGSLLDEEGLAMVAEMATEADAQIWIERVSKGSECSVILSDGKVLEPEAAAVA